VLIERGHEVGGGDTRFGVGTVARIAESVELPDGRWLLAAIGERRLRVVTWLPDDPYPVALIQELEPRTLEERDGELLAATERAVRRALAYKAELAEPATPATVELDADMDTRAFQLAAIAPLGPLDCQGLLEEDDPRRRVERLQELVEEENAVLARRLSGG
jgi:Lon protease-like protein